MTLEEKFHYEYEESGVYSYIPHSKEDFYDLVKLWTSVYPYSNHEAVNINLRLIPAFENRQVMIFKSGINTLGFDTWGWMTDDEYDEYEFNGQEVFEREIGDKLVFVDCVVIGGSRIARSCVRHLREFGKKFYKDAGTVYFMRLSDQGGRKSNVPIR